MKTFKEIVRLQRTPGHNENKKIKTQITMTAKKVSGTFF